MTASWFNKKVKLKVNLVIPVSKEGPRVLVACNLIQAGLLCLGHLVGQVDSKADAVCGVLVQTKWFGLGQEVCEDVIDGSILFL